MQIENQVRSVISIQNSSVLKSTYRTATTDETIGTTMKLVIGVPIAPDEPHIPYEPGAVRYFCPKYRFCYFVIKNILRTARKSYKFYK